MVNNGYKITYIVVVLLLVAANIGLHASVKDEIEIGVIPLSSAVSPQELVNALAASKQESACQCLSKMLTNGNLEERQCAIRVLGIKGDMKIVNELCSILNDKNDSRLKIAAVNALGLIQDPEAINVLVKSVTNEKFRVQQAAINALGLYGQQALTSLNKVYETADNKDKGPLLLAYGATCTQDALKIILNESKNIDPCIRSKALLSLRNYPKASAALDRLIQTLLDPDINCRLNATIALRSFHNTIAIKPLIHAINDTDIKVSASAVTALTGIEDPQVVDALLQACNSDKIYTKMAAMMALEKLRDTRVLPIIQAALDSDNYIYQCTTLLMLGHFHNTELTNDIIKKLDHIDEDKIHRKIGLMAIELLGNKGEKLGCEKLIAILRKTKDVEIQKAIIIALGKISDVTTVNYIIPYLSCVNPSLRQSAIVSLGRCKDTTATQPLLDLIKTPNISIDVRKNILMALGEIRDKKAVSTIIEFLNDTSPDISGAAADALGTIGDPSAIPSLLARLQVKGRDLPFGSFGSPLHTDLYTPVRVAIINSLRKMKDISTIDPIFQAGRNALYLVPVVVDALSVMDSIKVTDLCLKELKNTDRNSKYIAVQVLGKIGGIIAEDEFCRLLDDKDPELTVAIINSIGLLHCKNAIDILIPELTSNSSEIRVAASSALQRIGVDTSLSAISEGLKDTNYEIRADIIAGLGKSRDKSTISVLIPFLDDISPLVRHNAILAILLLNCESPYISQIQRTELLQIEK